MESIDIEWNFIVFMKEEWVATRMTTGVDLIISRRGVGREWVAARMATGRSGNSPIGYFPRGRGRGRGRGGAMGRGGARGGFRGDSRGGFGGRGGHRGGGRMGRSLDEKKGEEAQYCKEGQDGYWYGSSALEEKICRQFDTQGTCSYGEYCKFHHMCRFCLKLEAHMSARCDSAHSSAWSY
eukprot:348080_1